MSLDHNEVNLVREFQARTAGARDLPPVTELPGYLPAHGAILSCLIRAADPQLTTAPIPSELVEVTRRAGLDRPGVEDVMDWLIDVGLIAPTDRRDMPNAPVLPGKVWRLLLSPMNPPTTRGRQR